MKLSQILNLNVRHDLDVLDLVKDACLALTKGHTNPKAILERFGGFVLRYDSHFFEPEKLRKNLVPLAQTLTLDYTVSRSSDNTPGGFTIAWPRSVVPAKGVVLYPEEDWGYLQVLRYMWENNLRPASFYEHIAILKDYGSQTVGRVTVPFGGWTQPLKHECVGLLLACGNDLWYNEGGAGYSNGQADNAYLVCFTAVVNNM